MFKDIEFCCIHIIIDEALCKTMLSASNIGVSIKIRKIWGTGKSFTEIDIKKVRIAF